MRFSRTTTPGVWQATTPGYTARLQIGGDPGSGLQLRQLDGDAPGDWAVTVTAPTTERRVVLYPDRVYGFRRVPPPDTDTLAIAAQAGEDTLQAPMPGKIIQVLVALDDPVTEGQRLVVMEAMKMEFTIKAPHDGRVTRLPVAVGQLVEAGALLAEVT